MASNNEYEQRQFWDVMSLEEFFARWKNIWQRAEDHKKREWDEWIEYCKINKLNKDVYN